MLANAGIIRLMELDHAKDVKLAIAFSELYVAARNLKNHPYGIAASKKQLDRWLRLIVAVQRVDELTTAKV
jgi:hypothetical protein